MITFLAGLKDDHSEEGFRVIAVCTRMTLAPLAAAVRKEQQLYLSMIVVLMGAALEQLSKVSVPVATTFMEPATECTGEILVSIAVAFRRHLQLHLSMGYFSILQILNEELNLQELVTSLQLSPTCLGGGTRS